jgi:class 3 adenylate cyclase
VSEVRPDYASVSRTVVESGVKRPLPAGTVTFLFTDIEGSTRLLRELGDDYADLLAEHRRALREAFSLHGGVEVDTQGDAFFVAFAKATDATRRCVGGTRRARRGADPSAHGTAHR